MSTFQRTDVIPFKETDVIPFKETDVIPLRDDIRKTEESEESEEYGCHPFKG